MDFPRPSLCFRQAAQISTRQSRLGYACLLLFPPARLLVILLNLTAPIFHTPDLLTCQSTHRRPQSRTHSLFFPKSSPSPIAQECVQLPGNSHPAADCPSSPLTEKNMLQIREQYPIPIYDIF